MKKSLLLVISFFCVLSWAQMLQLELISNEINQPVELTHAGDDRIFVAQQNGIIRIMSAEGVLNTTPFLDISNLISASGERGLLGLAFSPYYANDGRFYINYTNAQGNTVIARYTVSNNPDIANTTGEILMTINQPYSNHNGGCLRFGPDGMLYISMGDGGSGGDPLANAQNINSLLGKMLRIDVSGTSGYTIPSDNPFVGESGMDEIWAYGLRNAWKFSFDELQNEILIADVGQSAWEEINRQDASIADNNYGWRCYEGDANYNTSGCASASEMIFPVAVYSHGGGRCSISGGFVYRGSYTNLQGKYIFADYCSNDIGVMHEDNSFEWVHNQNGVYFTGFGVDNQNDMYAFGSGRIYKIIGENMAVNDVAQEKVKISPNPTSGQFQIFGLSTIDKIQLYDLNGRLIQHLKVLENKVNINHLPSANYILQIESNKKYYTFQLLKR